MPNPTYTQLFANAFASEDVPGGTVTLSTNLNSSDPTDPREFLERLLADVTEWETNNDSVGMSIVKLPNQSSVNQLTETYQIRFVKATNPGQILDDA